MPANWVQHFFDYGHKFGIALQYSFSARRHGCAVSVRRGAPSYRLRVRMRESLKRWHRDKAATKVRWKSAARACSRWHSVDC